MNEEWRTIAEFPAYEVSTHGRVRRGERLLNPQRTAKGYMRVTLWRGRECKSKVVHRLVAAAFLSASDKPCVAHSNGDPADNMLTNLRYCTHAENERDKLTHGTAHVGTRHPRAKLDDDSVRHIRASGLSKPELALIYGVASSTIGQAQQRRTWEACIMTTARAALSGETK